MPPTTQAELIPDQAIKEKGRRWVRGIEIFATGRWNWEKYRHVWTPQDMIDIEAAAEPTMAEVEPVVITNHGEDKDDGVNRGFVARIYRNTSSYRDREGCIVPKGSRLLMDALVEEALFLDMKEGRYRRPSVELFENYKDLSGRVWPWVLTAVSIQGGKHLEAVRVLKPIIRTLAEQTYKQTVLPLHFRQEAKGRAITISFEAQEGPSMDEELKQILQQLLVGQQETLKALVKLAPPEGGVEAPAEMGQPKEPKMADVAAAPAATPAPSVAAPAAAAPAAQGPPTSITLKYSEIAQTPEYRALEQKLDEATRVAVTERELRLHRDRETDAEKFVRKLGFSEEMAKIAIQVRANAPSDGRLKFSDGQTYAQKVDDLLIKAGRQSMFEEQSLDLDRDEFTTRGSTGEVEKLEVQMKKFSEDGKSAGDVLSEIFKKDPAAYARYRKQVSVRV